MSLRHAGVRPALRNDRRSAAARAHRRARALTEPVVNRRFAKMAKRGLPISCIRQAISTTLSNGPVSSSGHTLPAASALSAGSAPLWRYSAPPAAPPASGSGECAPPRCARAGRPEFLLQAADCRRVDDPSPIAFKDPQDVALRLHPRRRTEASTPVYLVAKINLCHSLSRASNTLPLKRMIDYATKPDTSRVNL